MTFPFYTRRASFLARRRRGFTLAELLAAMIFMAIVVPVATQALTLSNRAGAVADRKRVAAELADRWLTEMITTEEWRRAERQGDFGDAWPGYRWTLEEQAWGKDAMREITVTVFFKVQDREYHVSLSSLAEEIEQ